MTTLVPSFLTTIKALISLNFCQIQHLTTESAALEYLKKSMSPLLYQILLKLADKEEMHIIFDRWMYSKFGKVGRQTTELDALKHPKNTPVGYNGESGVFLVVFFVYFKSIQNI